MKKKSIIVIIIVIALVFIGYFLVQFILDKKEIRLEKNIQSWQGLVIYNKKLAEKIFIIADVNNSRIQYDNGRMYSYILKDGNVYFSRYDKDLDFWSTVSQHNVDPDKSDITKLYEYLLEPVGEKIKSSVDTLTIQLDETTVKKITLLLDNVSAREPIQEIKSWKCEYEFNKAYLDSVLCFEDDFAIFKITFSTINKVNTSSMYQLPSDLPKDF